VTPALKDPELNSIHGGDWRRLAAAAAVGAE